MSNISKYQFGGQEEDLDLYSSNFFSNLLSQLSTQQNSYEVPETNQYVDEDRDYDDNPYTQEEYEDLLLRYEDLSQRYGALSQGSPVSYNNEFNDGFMDFLFKDDSNMPMDFSSQFSSQDDEDTIKNLYDKAKPYQGMSYGFGSEGQNGKIDCSAYTCRIIGQPRTTSEAILQQSKNLRKFDGSIESIQEGTVIGFDMGKTSYDAGRKMGIDHVGVVIKNPQTGELEFTESVSKKGVINRPLSEALNNYKGRSKSIYLGEYQLGGYVNVDSALNANKHVPFVDRILNANKYPVRKNNDGSISTHMMSYSDNIVYPTLRYVNGKWVENNDPTAAVKEGDFIEFPSPEQADYFSRNYKNSKLSKIPKRNHGGVARTPEELYKGLNGSSQTQLTLDLPEQYNLIRGLDNFKPVYVSDELGNEEILYGPEDITEMYGKVHEQKMQTGGKAKKLASVAGQAVTRSNSVGLALGNSGKGDDRFLDIAEEKEFMMDYLGSPNYKKRLQAQGYKNPDSIITKRFDRMLNSNYEEREDKPTQYDFFSNTVISNKAQLNSLNTDLPTAKVHELSHAAGALSPMFHTGMNSSDTQYINSRNKYARMKPYEIRKESFYDNTELDSLKRKSLEKGDFGHDKQPQEVKADLDALRFNLLKDKIYDTKTQDFNTEHLKKAKEKYKTNGAINRLFFRFSDKDLIDIMNNIASNKSGDSPVAQTGGATGAVASLTKSILNLNEPVKFLQDYQDSPKFKERLQTFNTDKEEAERIRGLAVVSRPQLRTWILKTGLGSFSNQPFSGEQIKLHIDLDDNKNDWREGRGYHIPEGTMAHEYGHFSRFNLTPKEKEAFINANKLKDGKVTAKTIYKDYKKAKANTNNKSNSNGEFELYNYFMKYGENEFNKGNMEESAHDLIPEENYADLQSLRYLLNKTGIYDARKGDLKKEHLDKLRKDNRYKDEFHIKRLMRSFKDEDIIRLNNTIGLSQNNESNLS